MNLEAAVDTLQVSPYQAGLVGLSARLNRIKQRQARYAQLSTLSQERLARRIIRYSLLGDQLAEQIDRFGFSTQEEGQRRTEFTSLLAMNNRVRNRREAADYYLKEIVFGKLRITEKGEWRHCSPELLESGVNCSTAPRRDCACSHDGSHDHWVTN